MALLYSIKKTQDRYFITNDELDTIYYEVTKLSDCVNYLSIFDGVILAGEEIEIIFPEDGEYQILLYDGATFETTPLPIHTILIKYYFTLQTSLIQSVYREICNCPCADCTGNSTCNYCSLLMTRAKIDVYKRLTNPEAVAFYNGVYNHTKCLVKDPIYCSVAEEVILGEATCNEKLVKQLIALDYLAMYFFEMAQVSTTADETYIREKFLSTKILCCIQDMGINIESTEQLITENNMGIFTINTAGYINLPPSQVGDNTISVPNRVNYILNLDMFTVDTIPPYLDPEGDAALDIRIDTLPADGTLTLSTVPIVVGQIIPVADIVGGLLAFETPDQDAADVDTFNFSIRDAGSGLFSS